MAKLHNQNRAVEAAAKVVPVEWSTPQPFWPEVKEDSGLVNRQKLERIRYVKLVIGVFDHRAPGGAIGIHEQCGNGRMDC